MKKTVMSAAVLVAMIGNAEAGTLDFLDDWNKSDFYLGVLVSNSDISGETGAGEDMGMINATFGYLFPKGISLEARLGLGTDETESLFQDPVTTYTAAMFRYHYTWRHNVMTYASVGASLRTHSNVVDVDDVQAGAAYAFGMNLFGSDTASVNIEYLYLGGPDALSSIGIGFHRYFGKY